MTAIRSAIEFRNISDFTSPKNLSKRQIIDQLRCAEVLEAKFDKDVVTFIVNNIKVGMYVITLSFADSQDVTNTGTSRSRLTQYGRFLINIYENAIAVDKHGIGHVLSKDIEISRDRRFKHQKWSNKETFNINELADVIMHCNRLNDLKAFL